MKALLWNSTQQTKRINLILFKARKVCQKDCILYILFKKCLKKPILRDIIWTDSFLRIL